MVKLIVDPWIIFANFKIYDPCLCLILDGYLVIWHYFTDTNIISIVETFDQTFLCHILDKPAHLFFLSMHFLQIFCSMYNLVWNSHWARQIRVTLRTSRIQNFDMLAYPTWNTICMILNMHGVSFFLVACNALHWDQSDNVMYVFYKFVITRCACNHQHHL